MANKRTARPSMLSIKIIYALLKNKKGITVKQIAEIVESDYKNVHNTVEALAKESIIRKEKLGNYNICRLDFSNDDLLQYLKEANYYLGLIRYKKKNPVEYRKEIEKCKSLAEKNPFLILFADNKTIISDDGLSPIDFIKDLKTRDSQSSKLFDNIPIVLYGDDIFFRMIIKEGKWRD